MMTDGMTKWQKKVFFSPSGIVDDAEDSHMLSFTCLSNRGRKSTGDAWISNAHNSHTGAAPATRITSSRNNSPKGPWSREDQVVPE